jgi:hypothetical protein
MASLFDLLRDTLPIAAAEYAMTNGGKLDLDDLDGVHAGTFLAALKTGEDYTADVPAYMNWPDAKDQRLWSWKHQAADPATISDVWCRVHNAGFSSHKVLDQLQWGWEDPQSGELQQLVKVVTMDGTVLELPLTREFVDSRFVVYDGYVPEDHSDLWKLETRLDKGLVVAFVYEIDVQHQIHPWRARNPKDSNEAGQWSDYNDAMQDIPPHTTGAPRADCETTVTVGGWPDMTKPGEEEAPKAPSADTTVTVVTTCKNPWGGRIRRAELMPASAMAAAVAGEVPSTAPASVDHMRVLVVLSFAVCRERSDYEPGGVVGMARLFPHVMVKADVPLKTIEATVRFDRPEKTQTREDGLPDKPKSCCLTYDVADEAIDCILVSDANNSGQPHGGPVSLLPFWGNMFAYYQPHAFTSLGRVPLKMTRTDRRDERTDDTGLVERDVVLRPRALNPVKEIQKMPHQGEFDNIHMAPKLKLVGVTHILVDGQMLPIDRDMLRLDDIPMAPFCAHDCFHMHWRWGTDATIKWALGWDETGPHKVAGAPLVPLNQDVEVWFRSPHQFTCHSIVGREDGSAQILPACEWQVICHQGTSYAVEMTGWLQWLLAQMAFDKLAPPPDFFKFPGDVPDPRVSSSPPPLPAAWATSAKEHVSVEQSTALVYWYARYRVVLNKDFTIELIERSRTDTTRLWKARML